MGRVAATLTIENDLSQQHLLAELARFMSRLLPELKRPESIARIHAALTDAQRQLDLLADNFPNPKDSN